MNRRPSVRRPLRAVCLVATVVAALTLAGTAWSASELEQARALGNRIVALYKTPAGLCKLGTVAGDPCTAKAKAELAPIFKTYGAEIAALSLRSLREIGPHRYRSPLGPLAGQPVVLDLRTRGGKWQLLDADTGTWFTVPAWLLK